MPPYAMWIWGLVWFQIRSVRVAKDIYLIPFGDQTPNAEAVHINLIDML
jgi:enoyl-CoA hydratase/carnithine racemase